VYHLHVQLKLGCSSDTCGLMLSITGSQDKIYSRKPRSFDDSLGDSCCGANGIPEGRSIKYWWVQRFIRI
jgi:hypothetical protein